MFKKMSRPRVRRILGLSIIALLAVMGALPFIRTQAASSIKVQIDKGGGTDNTQETTFNFLVKNVTTTAVSGISARVYFTPDGSNTASGYTLEKYYDQSGVATVSGPTLLSGTTYYFTINYGTASLASGAQWEFQTALHLSSWGSTYNGGNDYYHTGYAVGALPAAYTDTNYITAYTSGTLAWGTEPGGSTATNTFVPPTTAVPTKGSTADDVPLPDLTVTSIANAPSTVPCGSGWNPGTNVTIANSGSGSAGSFVVSLNASGTPLTMNVTSLAAGQSTTLRFSPNGGALTATADSTGVITETNETNNSLSKTLPVSDPIPCTVTPTMQAPGDFGLLTITGQVLGSSGALAGASVSVSATGVRGTSSGTATTDASGNYSVPNIHDYDTSTISVTVSATGYITQTVQRDGLSTSTNRVFNVTLVPTGTAQADLTITSITYGDQPAPCMVATGVKVWISNKGNANAGPFVVRLTLAGGSPVDQTVPGLDYGQQLTVTFGGFGQGQTFTAMADANNVVTESNENNNTFGTTLPVMTPPAACTPGPSPTFTPTAPAGPLPDLVITEMYTTTVGFVCYNQWSKIHLTVKNAGNASAGSFVVHFTGDRQEDITTAGLGAGQSVAIDSGVTSATPGGSVIAVADYTSLVTEINETNNSKSIIVDASSSPTCTPTPGAPITLTPTPTATCACGVTNTFTPTPTIVTLTPTPMSCFAPCVDIKIVDFAFQPASVTSNTLVNSHTNFRWTNTGNTTHTITSDVAGLFDSGPIAPGQTFVASVDSHFSTNTVTYHCSIHTSMTGSLTVIYPTITPIPTTPVPPTTVVPPPTTQVPTKTFTPTPTPTGSITPSKTNTPTLTPSKTVTPGGTDPCASATTITGGGTFTVTTATTCFKYVNTSFVNGGMFSVMKDGTSASDTIKWYGGMDQNATACTNQSSTVSGNGGQLNNFTVSKDANGQMFLIVTGSASNSITLSMQNWQNGAGCSVKPTVHP